MVSTIPIFKQSKVFTMNDLIQPKDGSILLVQEEPLDAGILIEIPVTGTGQKVKLPDVQQLRSMKGQNIIIKGIRLITAKVLARAITLNFANAPLVELQNCSLTLYSMGWQRRENWPLLTFNDVNDSDATTATTIPFVNKPVKLDSWQNVAWSQSFLTFCNGFVPTPPYAVLLWVDYLKLDDNGNPILGAS